MHLFDRLVQNSKKEWDKYVNHKFKTLISSGEMNFDKFQNYLIQDYLYLQEYKIAFDNLNKKAAFEDEKEFASNNSKSVIESEIKMQKDINSSIQISSISKSLETKKYETFFQKIAKNGDYLDLLIALSVCSIGYYTLGSSIKNETTKNIEYLKWINMYRDPSYREYVKKYKMFIDKIAKRYNLNEKKFKNLLTIFQEGIQHEITFFNQGV